MGSASSRTSRAVLKSPEQLTFKAAHVKKGVAEVVKLWFEEGAPLGLTAEIFQQFLAPGARPHHEALFHLFDTDQNHKVDAFEVLSAAILLADGTTDEKFEALFPLFDFSGTGRLNFDEVNILAQSVDTGLSKVCQTSSMSDQELVQACRQMFDAHNLPYDKHITREQVRRWLRSDVEAVSFVESFHKACVLPEIEAALKEQERAQAAIFAQITGGQVDSMPVEVLLRSQDFRHSLANPSDDALRGFVGAMLRPEDGREVHLERYAEATRAWSTFTALGPSARDEVDAKDLALLLWLWRREEPTPAAVEQQLEVLGVQGPGDQVSRAVWVTACLHTEAVASSAPPAPEELAAAARE
jgi:hypothetical protein